MKRVTRKFTISIAAIYFLLIATQEVYAGIVKVHGKVFEEDTGKLIPTAEVMFISNAGDTTRTTTDIDGYYEVFLEVYPTSVDEALRPENVILYQNYPNPFNPTTTIVYELNRAVFVLLDVYSINGQRVRCLRKGYENSGVHSVVWDGLDDRGNAVAAGIYIYWLKAGKISAVKKMLLLDGGGYGSVFSCSVSGFNQFAKVSKTSETYYDIVVEKEGYETYNREDFFIPDGVSELWYKDIVLMKDIVLTNGDFFPLAYGNFWDFRKLDLENEKALNETFSISIIDTTIIDGNKYFLMIQKWNVNIPDSIYIMKKGSKVFWHMNGEDLMVYDFEVPFNSSWEATLPSFGSNEAQTLTIQKIKMDDISIHKHQFFKFSIQGGSTYWYVRFARNEGPNLIHYSNQDFVTEVTGVLEHVFLIDVAEDIDYDYPSLWNYLSSIFN